MHNTLCRYALALILSLSVCPAALPTSAVNADEQKPKREKFGSSLKRLKWDQTKQAAVDKPEKPGNKKPKEHSQADAAIKLKTLLVTFDVLVTDASHTRVIAGLGKDDFVV